MKTTMITISIIGILIIIATFYGLSNVPQCIEKESDGYYARTKMGNKYFLADTLEEANKMYNGLITQEKRCIKWNK